MTAVLSARRVRAALGRALKTRGDDPWQKYLTVIEPVLGARLRLHRFASPPMLVSSDTPAAPLAVWIEGDGPAAERTREALTTGSVPPAIVLDGDLASALAATNSDHVLLIEAGDEPAPPALEYLGQAATMAPDAAVITCDEDQLTSGKARQAPRFRPGPSPDRWLARDDSGSMIVVSRSRSAAYLSELTGGPGWRHELALMLAGAGSEHHVHVPLLLCHRAAGAAAAPPLPTAAAARVLHRWEPNAKIEQAGTARWVRRPPADEPSVEVIVCFRDRPELLARCLVSMLARTDYEHLRVALVDNGSARQETEVLLAGLARHPRVRVLHDPRPFNFAALNNAAAASSPAEVLVFLNNDTEVIDGDWLTVMLEEALRPEIGAVAPLLLYPDGTVQHAGAALGLHGYAGHPFAGLDPDAETPFGRATEGTRNWLAVTAACLMVERTKFMGVGGFDETFVVAGNDVDLCLRLTAAGHRSVFVPHTRLLHDESRSRGTLIDPGDFVASRRSYGAFLTAGDPFYNPNLTLKRTDCGVRDIDEKIP